MTLIPQAIETIRRGSAELIVDGPTVARIFLGEIRSWNDAEALYFASSFYAPGLERGVRWNDPRFAIDWPITPLEISPKDAGWPDFDNAFHGTNQLTGLI